MINKSLVAKINFSTGCILNCFGVLALGKNGAKNTFEETLVKYFNKFNKQELKKVCHKVVFNLYLT
ncbi:MAG: hypothetical protein CL524_03925 [Aequorivita sp.]|nr:hypothetical protein [Aequorivita sp.]MBF31547.1 hypothetical protein [Aequorivita sp.]|tara:strand:- start:23449 stop:23646 length:198 start_codon:yes stop_codon:yes gene_type:complete